MGKQSERIANERRASRLPTTSRDSSSARQHVNPARLGSRRQEIVLGHFQIEDFLSWGSEGSVYRGHELQEGYPVAIKIIRPSDDPRAHRRHEREVYFLTQLSNPHVVRLIEHGVTKHAETVIVMELLRGTTLQKKLVEGHVFSVSQVVDLGQQIATAVGSLHELGAAHRDISPNNIFIEQNHGRDWVKLIDFGLVKPIGAARSRTGHLIGTPTYMSPEHVATRPIDERSDIYSLGVVLFEMLTGKPPFTGAITEVMAQHVERPVPPLHRVRPDFHFPPSLEEFLRSCLEKDPQRRPSSMQDVMHRLQAASVFDAASVAVRFDSKEIPTDLIDGNEILQRVQSTTAITEDVGFDSVRVAPARVATTSFDTEEIDVLRFASKDALTTTIDTDDLELVEQLVPERTLSTPTAEALRKTDLRALDHIGSRAEASPWEGEDSISTVDLPEARGYFSPTGG